MARFGYAAGAIGWVCISFSTKIHSQHGIQNKKQSGASHENRPSHRDDAAADYADELWFFRHSIQLRPAANRHHAGVQLSQCRSRLHSAFTHGRPRYRPDCAADYRRFERPHLGKRPRAAAALFFNRRHRLQPVPVSLPARYRLVDGRAAAVDARHQQQHRHGALPRLYRRHLARAPAAHRLSDAERVYRAGHHAGQCVALCVSAIYRRHHRIRHSLLGVRLVLCGRGLLHRLDSDFGVFHPRTPPQR